MELIKNQDFMLRRIHSLLGIVPMGVFLFEHFAINSFALHGPEAFNEKVHFLRSLPYLDFLEWGGIFFPFLLHILLGIVIIYQGRPNPFQYRYTRNYMYVLQRWTALIALGFIVFHVVSLRFFHDPDKIDFFTLLAEIFTDPALASLYVIGCAAAIFHFCNGFCTFLMTWGITVSPKSQLAAAIASTLLGVGMFAVIINAMMGFIVWKYPDWRIFGF